MASLSCQECGAVVEMADNLRTGKCVYCGSPQIRERPPTEDRPNPTFVVPFVVTQERALEEARKFVRRPLLAPEAFRNAEITAIRGIYLPTYLYSGEAHSSYRAQIGENYTETQTYTTTSNGRTVTRTRTVTKTEYRDLSGEHSVFISDRVVSGSNGLRNEELEFVEPFDMRALHRFDGRLISGWVAEEPTLSPSDCLSTARQEALEEVGRQLHRFMPGDSHRDLTFQTDLQNEDLELALLPVWVLPVRYLPDKPPVRLIVNGQSGKLWAKPPRSPVKIAILVLLVLGLIALVIGAFMLLASTSR